MDIWKGKKTRLWLRSAQIYSQLNDLLCEEITQNSLIHDIKYFELKEINPMGIIKLPCYNCPYKIKVR